MCFRVVYISQGGFFCLTCFPKPIHIPGVHTWMYTPYYPLLSLLSDPFFPDVVHACTQSSRYWCSFPPTHSWSPHDCIYPHCSCSYFCVKQCRIVQCVKSCLTKMNALIYQGLCRVCVGPLPSPIWSRMETLYLLVSLLNVNRFNSKFQLFDGFVWKWMKLFVRADNTRHWVVLSCCDHGVVVHSFTSDLDRWPYNIWQE